jgi:hypothetical protein
MTVARSGGRLAVVLCLLACATDAHAYRPFDGTDADAAPLGEFELELGPTHYYRETGRNYLISPASVLNLGIFPQTELVVDFENLVALGTLSPGEPRVFMPDTDILIKHVFREGVLQDQTGLSIAAEMGLLLPDVNGTDAFGASLDVITSYRWSFGAFHWNEWAEYTREHDFSLFTGVILEGPHDWTVRPVAELFVEREFNVETTYSGLVGAIWTLEHSFSLDVGVRAGSIDGAQAEEVRLGLTWAVPVWKPPGANKQAW